MDGYARNKMKMAENGIHDRPLRVAHVAMGLDTGGMEKLLVEFARLADRGRFQLRFITLGGRGKLADDIEAYRWPVTVLARRRYLGLRLASPVDRVVRLARLFRRWNVD